MGQTDIYKLRWPERTGVAADGPDGYQDLATDIENQMIRMRSRTYAQGQVTLGGYVPCPPGQSRTLFDFNLIPPVAGWVQVEWFWACQWKPGTWHGGRVTGTLGVPGLAQSVRAQRWANYGFAMNGGQAGRLANPTLNRLGQRFTLVVDTDGGSDPNGNFQITRAGYCIQYYGGNPIAMTNAYQLGHYDYVNIGTAAVSTYTMSLEQATVVGDWLYLVHMHRRETADVTVTPPAGFVSVVATQLVGTATNGIQWNIWRKKRATGDTDYKVTLSGARHCRATLITVRQPNDNLPTLSALVAPRAATNPSKVTVPGNVAVQAGALVIPVVAQNTGPQSPAQPPTVTGATTWFTVYNKNANGSANDSVFLSVATRSYTDSMNTDPAVFTWNVADVGLIGGVALIFPPA